MNTLELSRPLGRLAASKWLSCPQPNPAARLRLWCLPFAGGGAAAWHPWAGRLQPEIEVVGLRLPGRENRLAEKPFSEPTRLIAALVNELAPYAREPYALLGHSLGGLLAYEVARGLRLRGLPLPRGLIVSGMRAPQLPRTEPDLHQLPDPELVAEVDQRYGGIPPELRADRDLLALVLPALRADLAVYETYRYPGGSPLSVPLLALGGESDPVVSHDQIRGWAELTSGPFVVDFFPGGHFFLQTDFSRVAERVQIFLRQI